MAMGARESPKDVGGKRAVYDIESNGYLYESTKIHCICLEDIDTGDTYSYHTDNGSHDILRGIEHLDSFILAGGHNICGFDIPLVYKLYGVWPQFSPRDTYVMSRMFYPEQALHSLDFYGKMCGRFKPVHEDFSKFTPEMLYRCSEDVGINVWLYKRFVNKHFKKWKWIEPLKLEQDFQIYQTLQEMVGVDIDVELAGRVLAKIDKEVAEIDAILDERLPMRITNGGAVNRPFKNDGSYSKMNLDWWTE